MQHSTLDAFHDWSIFGALYSIEIKINMFLDKITGSLIKVTRANGLLVRENNRLQIQSTIKTFSD